MDDAKWFVGFLLVFGIIWLSGKSNPSRQPSPHATSTPKTRGIPAEVGPRRGTPKKEVISAPPASTVLPSAPISTTPSEDISPFYGRLTIGSLNRGTLGNEYVIIQASSKNVGDTDITGVTIRSGIGLTGETIGKGWTAYFPGTVGEGDPILLRPGNRVYVLSGRPPGGMTLPSKGGFQLNLCTGFFEQGQNFYPGLPLQCPRPENGPLLSSGDILSEDCYTYLKRIPRCTVPSSVPKNLASDGNCRAYALTKINYGQCVVDYRKDPRFLRGEWRVYLGRGTRLWRDGKEIIEILDKDGKLIARKQYGS